MAIYECQVCGQLYDEDKEGKPWSDLPDDWTCPICDSEKSEFDIQSGEATEEPTEAARDESSDSSSDYLAQWKRPSDELESAMRDIHRIAETGESLIEPMRTRRPTPSWDEILVKGAQLHKLPLNPEEGVNVETVIGPKAKRPLVIDSPVIVSHMSFGALSREIKIALAQGSAAAGTAICSGEGGILDDELNAAHKYIFEYVPNKYSVTDDNLAKVDAVEIKIGQSAKPGMGGHLPGAKVTDEIARVRGRKPGEDIHSPSRFAEVKDKNDLKNIVQTLRERTGGKPIGVKLAAGDVENDVAAAVFAEPDFITIDGRAGATGAAPKFVKDATSMPTVFALRRARKALDQSGVEGISLIVTGGLRISSDFAKAIAMGADAVAVATAALIACGCQQYRMCHTGKCPIGITSQDPELRKRLKIEQSARRLENFLAVSSEELKTFARLTGHDDVHKMSHDDLCATNSEISDHTDIAHV